jgi:hypothetical protein
MSKEKIIKEFDEYWGESPKGSAKYKAREKAKQFLLEKIHEALLDCVPETPKTSEDSKQAFIEYLSGFNHCREQIINNINEKYGY